MSSFLRVPPVPIPVAAPHVSDVFCLRTPTEMLGVVARRFVARVESLVPRGFWPGLSGFLQNYVGHQGVSDDGAGSVVGRVRPLSETTVATMSSQHLVQEIQGFSFGESSNQANRFPFERDPSFLPESVSVAKPLRPAFWFGASFNRAWAGVRVSVSFGHSPHYTLSRNLEGCFV